MRAMARWFVRQYADDIITRVLAEAKRKAAETESQADDRIVGVLLNHRQAFVDLLKLI